MLQGLTARGHGLVGPRVAREMFFAAEPVPAERAVAVGILDHLAPGARLEEFTLAIASRIAENSRLAVGVIEGKRAFLKERKATFAGGAEPTPRVVVPAASTSGET